MSKIFGSSPQSSNVQNLESFLSAIIDRKKVAIKEKFQQFDTDNDGNLTREQLEVWLYNRLGLDPKSAEVKESLDEFCNEQGCIQLIEFTRLMTEPNVLQRAINGDLAIPAFPEFCEDIVKIFEKTSKNEEGTLPTYIPELANQNPDLYSLALCTVDSQRFSHGDTDMEFTLQALALPLVYCLALEQHSIKKVNEYIGREPSGSKFNDFVLNEEQKPHNPMINCGGIVSSSLIEPKTNPSERYARILDIISQMAGGRRLNFNQRVYLSEKNHADRNYALAYYMKGMGTKGLQDEDLNTILDFYFQVCSISCDVETLSIIAATLANGGICPTTKKRVLKSSTVRQCLSILYTCGMNDSSGEFSFTVGLVAKTGISGGMLLIVPNVLGIALLSPRVNEHGHSVRGLEFAKQLSKTFSFSIFDQLVSGISTKIDPTEKQQ